MNTDEIIDASSAMTGISILGSILALSGSKRRPDASCLNSRSLRIHEKQGNQEANKARMWASISGLTRVSHWLGVEVRDHKKERLGKIVDLVIDFKSKEVAYAVLSVSEDVESVGGKLLAVPLPAFIQTSDVDCLYLYADHKKLSGAQEMNKESGKRLQSLMHGAEPLWTPGTKEEEFSEDSQPDIRA